MRFAFGFVSSAVITFILTYAYGWVAAALAVLLSAIVFILTTQSAIAEADALIHRILDEELLPQTQRAEGSHRPR